MQLFPVHDSEVILRRSGREAGGAGAGSSSFFLRAGEDFEAVVAIKTQFGPVLGKEALHMMQEIHLLPEGVMQRTGEPTLSAQTGTATFQMHFNRSGDFEVSAAVKCNGVSHTIGKQICVKVVPGAIRFASLDTKASAEVGEQLQLRLKMSDKDVFGNTIELPLSAHAKADLADLSLRCTWIHKGKEAPLNLLQPVVVDGDLLVAKPQLLLPGNHTFRIDTSGQTLTADVEVSPGLPHSVRLIGDGKPHVLQRRRWCSKIDLLNGQDAVVRISGDQLSVELAPMSENGGRTYPLQFETVTCEASVWGCSLSNVESSAMLPALTLFLLEPHDAPRAGTYRLQVKRVSDGFELSCDPSTIHLDLPLDPAAWTSQELAQCLRLDDRFVIALEDSQRVKNVVTIHTTRSWAMGGGFGGVCWGGRMAGEGGQALQSTGAPALFPSLGMPVLISTVDHVVKDEFDAEIDGKDLIERGPQLAWSRLKDGLFLGRRFSNQKEKDEAENRIRGFTKQLFEKHTLAGLGKGRYQSSVAKSISESDLNIEPDPLDTGGYSEIFRGHYEGQPVAVKIPLVKDRGLEVSDHTACMMQELERELTVMKSCRHQNVIQVKGLMVGPGRIGIVMELCDSSLAKRIQEQAGTTNWAESVRLLMDGTAGLDFIHQQKGTTHGDVKPDNLLIQKGRLKVADFGLATVRRTITNLTGKESRKGTTFFMPPEKLIGRGSNLSSTDVWAFGCGIANVVTGRSPFSEDKSEQALLVSLRQKKPVYKRAHVRPGCPEKVLEIIDRCTQYDPTLRPTMTEVGEELRRVLQGIQSQDGFALPALWQERGCLLDSSELMECPQGSRDHDLIKARVEEEMCDEEGTRPTVLKVEMNANVDLLRRYDLEKKKVAGENGGDANEVWLWHATRSDGAEQSILKNGFDLNRCGGSHNESN